MQWRPYAFRVQEFLVLHRIFVTAALGVFIAPIFALGLRAYSDPKETAAPWAVAFVALYLVQFLAAISPPHYAKTALLESILPTIYAVLELRGNDRLAIHHLKSKSRQLYEQRSEERRVGKECRSRCAPHH